MKKIKKTHGDDELKPGTEDYKKRLRSITGETFRSDKCREGEGAKWISGYLNKKGINSPRYVPIDGLSYHQNLSTFSFVLFYATDYRWHSGN